MHDLSAPPTRAERALNRRIADEQGAAKTFRRATAAYRAAVEAIPSDLLWVPGYDKPSILAETADWMRHTDAGVREFVETRMDIET